MTFIRSFCFAICLAVAAQLAAAQPTSLLPLDIRASGSYLGVTLADVNPDLAKELKLPEVTGAEVVAVMEGTPAHQAGLRANDVVLSYNGETVLGKEQLARLVMETPPGRRVNLVCWRAGKKQQMVVTTGAFRPPPTDDVTLLTAWRVTDVPSTIMIWRNLVLGIESESISEQLAQAFGVKQGILIWAVAASSPAQHAGLKAGDVLTDFCGHPIRSPRDVGITLQQVQGNSAKAVTISVVRDHKPVFISISLDGTEH